MLMIYEYYDRNLKKNNALDFDDLLLLPYQIFSKKTEILHKRQKKFSYVMVDEAQDTNRIQFELMRMLT
jgi:DNA helicase-2/ATP-dependent DNA helicase PcrA